MSLAMRLAPLNPRCATRLRIFSAPAAKGRRPSLFLALPGICQHRPIRNISQPMTHDPNQFLAFVWSGWTATWPTQLLALIWVAWLISWAVGSIFSGRTEKHVRTWDSRAYRIPILVGAVLLLPWTARVLGEQPIVRVGNGGTYVLGAVALAGVLFTWW